MQAGGHDRDFLLRAGGDVAFSVTSHDSADRFQSEFVWRFVDHKAGGIVAVLERDLPPLESKRNAGTRIKDRFVEPVLSHLGADLG